MVKFQRLFIARMFALLLTFLLFLGPNTWSCPTGEVKNDSEESFKTALSEYQGGLYESAAAKLEFFLNSTGVIKPEFRAKVYLLLGACHEKCGDKNRAKECFLKIKKILDEGLIGQVPAVPGINPESLTEYQKVFEEHFFKFEEPTAVVDIMTHNVVHAPRKSIEEKEKEKKKKKFLGFITVVAALIVGTAAVLLLTSKRNKSSEFPEIEWVKIPAGEFQMGDNFNEGQSDELPVHRVYLDGYYISKFEITIEQYYYFCEDTGKAKPDLYKYKFPHNYIEVPTGLPVHKISWLDATVFCGWLSGQTGKNVHLPTEAQWEKAARGAQQYRYPWGNNPPDCAIALFLGCSPPNWAYLDLMPVNSFREGRSPYGAYNMAGNVWEWCQDWYSPSYYSLSPGKNPLGPANGSKRVMRGGGNFSFSRDIRSASRDCAEPGYTDKGVGFRVVMED